MLSSARLFLFKNTLRGHIFGIVIIRTYVSGVTALLFLISVFGQISERSCCLFCKSSCGIVCFTNSNILLTSRAPRGKSLQQRS